MLSRDLALAIASDGARASDEMFPLDRLRMQKAAFLIAMRGTERLRGLYHFVPYNWGPYCGDLTADLQQLLLQDDLTIEDIPGQRHGAYATTPTGELKATHVWAQLTPSEQTFIRSVRSYVTRRSFSHLLREVYAEYPEYATRSQFTG